MARTVAVGGGEKGGHSGREKRASGVVTLWTSSAQSRAKIDSSSSRARLAVAVRQLWLPCGNRATRWHRRGSCRLEPDHQIMIPEMRMRVKENLLE